MLRSIDISTSGLMAQRQRMNTISGNIANAFTTRDPDGNLAPFQRRLITFSTDETEGAPIERGVGVKYQVEVDSKTPPRQVHEPGHPDADENGFVSYPNINMITEFVNAMEASRAYEANVAVVEMSKAMANIGMKIIN